MGYQSGIKLFSFQLRNWIKYIFRLQLKLHAKLEHLLTLKRKTENSVNFPFSVSIPICSKRINRGYYPAICRLYSSFFLLIFFNFQESTFKSRFVSVSLVLCLYSLQYLISFIFIRFAFSVVKNFINFFAQDFVSSLVCIWFYLTECSSENLLEILFQNCSNYFLHFFLTFWFCFWTLFSVNVFFWFVCNQFIFVYHMSNKEQNLIFVLIAVVWKVNNVVLRVFVFSILFLLKNFVHLLRGLSALCSKNVFLGITADWGVLFFKTSNHELFHAKIVTSNYFMHFFEFLVLFLNSFFCQCFFLVFL